MPWKPDDRRQYDAPTANANGRAIIEGDLLFDGFNTLLAGIYISMNGKISAANGGRFAYYGTQEDDDVNIDVDSVGEVTVDTGDGDDTVNLTVQAGADGAGGR